jgi:hypothetical protein
MSGAHNRNSKRRKMMILAQKFRLKETKKIQKKNNSISTAFNAKNNGSNSNNYNSNVESLPDNFLKPGNSIVGSNNYMHREVKGARNQLGYNIFNLKTIKKYKAGNKNTKNLFEELTNTASNITRSMTPTLRLPPGIKRRRLLKTRKQK